MNFKEILIGKLIQDKVSENEIEISRICNFFKCDEKFVLNIYNAENISTDLLLKWSKLLEYDFFRLYSQHLILYAPPAGNHLTNKKNKSKLPEFRKSIYTNEIIDFILDLIKSGKKTKKEVIDEYRIPKTTLYKWISKHSK